VALAGLLASLTIMLIGLSMAAPGWHYVVKDSKEQELLFRGLQIVRAVREQQKKYGALGTLDNMVAAKRLRKSAIKDPMHPQGKWKVIQQGIPETDCGQPVHINPNPGGVPGGGPGGGPGGTGGGPGGPGVPPGGHGGGGGGPGGPGGPGRGPGRGGNYGRGPQAFFEDDAPGMIPGVVADIWNGGGGGGLIASVGLAGLVFAWRRRREDLRARLAQNGGRAAIAATALAALLVVLAQLLWDESFDQLTALGLLAAWVSFAFFAVRSLLEPWRAHGWARLVLHPPLPRAFLLLPAAVGAMVVLPLGAEVEEIQMPVYGVRSTVKDQSLRIYLGKNHYHEWCFSPDYVSEDTLTIDQMVGRRPNDAMPEFKPVGPAKREAPSEESPFGSFQ
jgi:type II secretory pathway pseudopilin PulG